jgi:hypothetical protein
MRGRDVVILLVVLALGGLVFFMWRRRAAAVQAMPAPAFGGTPTEYAEASPGGSSLAQLYGLAAQGACTYATGGGGAGSPCQMAGAAGRVIGEEINTALPKSGIIRTIAVSNPVVAGNVYLGKKAVSAGRSIADKVRSWF